MEGQKEISETRVSPKIMVIFWTIGLVALIIGVAALGLYTQQRRDFQNYKLTFCHVLKSELDNEVCTDLDCQEYGEDSSSEENVDYAPEEEHQLISRSSDCIPGVTECYFPKWSISYTVDEMEIITSIRGVPSPNQNDATGELGEVQAGASYRCYYNNSDRMSVRWSIPQSTAWLVTMSVGLSIAVSTVIGTIGWLICRCRQEKPRADEIEQQSLIDFEEKTVVEEEESTQ